MKTEIQVHIIGEDDNGFAYESPIAPRVGEEITLHDSIEGRHEHFEVVRVAHLVSRNMQPQTLFLSMVSVEVKRAAE